MRKIQNTSLLPISICTFVSLGFVFYCLDVSRLSLPTLPRLNDHSRPTNFSTVYHDVVLLSCSSYALTSAYCYYMPIIALAWRRLGFEPILLLIGSSEIFKQMPLWSFINRDFHIEYHIIEVDNSRAIATSQIARLFADVDLLPITRHRFELTNRTSHILAVNANCCPSERFSFGNLTKINYYPISYVSMSQQQWQNILLPSEKCHFSSNLTVDMIECYLMDKMNITIPRNVIKGSKQWDIDQKLLSILIARAERYANIKVDKRKLGRRLDPHRNFLRNEFESILSYDDVHLANSEEKHLFNNQTWSTLASAFSRLFRNDTVQLLARYHYKTAAAAGRTMSHENR